MIYRKTYKPLNPKRRDMPSLMWNLRGRVQHKDIDMQVRVRSVIELHAIKILLVKSFCLFKRQRWGFNTYHLENIQYTRI